MTDAVVVSTARTPLAKAFRGAFNNTHSGTLGGHAIRHAIARAGIDGAEIDDVIFGCAIPEGDGGNNIARHSALVGGLPVSTGAVTIARACSSGIQAGSFAAQRIIVDRVVAGGVESVSMVSQTQHVPKAGRGALDPRASARDASNNERDRRRPLANARQRGPQCRRTIARSDPFHRGRRADRPLRPIPPAPRTTGAARSAHRSRCARQPAAPWRPSNPD